MIRFPLGALLSITCVLCAAARADTVSEGEASKPADGVTVAVADFSGPDKDLGRFLADTLLTDLAQSKQLILVERAQIGQALTELKLQSSGLAEPKQVTRLGRLVGADHLIVGSYFVQDNQLLINARLLNVDTGRLMPNGGANVEGAKDDVLALVRRLAQRLHRRVTGEDLPFADEKTKPLPETSATFTPPAPKGDAVPAAPDYKPESKTPDLATELPLPMPSSDPPSAEESPSAPQDVLAPDPLPAEDVLAPDPTPFQTRIIYYAPPPVYAVPAFGYGAPVVRFSFPTRRARLEPPGRRLRIERSYGMSFRSRGGGFHRGGYRFGGRRR